MQRNWLLTHLKTTGLQSDQIYKHAICAETFKGLEENSKLLINKR